MAPVSCTVFVYQRLAQISKHSLEFHLLLRAQSSGQSNLNMARAQLDQSIPHGVQAPTPEETGVIGSAVVSAWLVQRRDSLHAWKRPVPRFHFCKDRLEKGTSTYTLMNTARIMENPDSGIFERQNTHNPGWCACTSTFQGYNHRATAKLLHLSATSSTAVPVTTCHPVHLLPVPVL